MALNLDVIVIGSGFGAAVAAIDQPEKGRLFLSVNPTLSIVSMAARAVKSIA